MSARAVICSALLALATCAFAAEAPILIDVPKRCTVFRTVEISLDPIAESLHLGDLPDTQMHDAYDADRDGRLVIVELLFHKGDRKMAVPGFAMRDGPNGPWHWRARWYAPEAGRWTVGLKAYVRLGGGRTRLLSKDVVGAIDAVADPALTGPLVAPKAGENPRYLRRLKPDGTSEAVWLFGACRAWNVRGNADAGVWSPHEWIDRETELFPPLRDAGYNLLLHWMAPWEYLLVHHDRAERWRKPDDTWARAPLPEGAEWTPWQCYDQGRAADFDRLVRLCEGDADKPLIRLLLTPLAHQSLQASSHLWGWNESGWHPEDDAGRQTLEKLNGFSAFRREMGPWDFFKADPTAPADDWRSQLFDHQANFWRYIMARWGGSRALGAWVIVDELDGVGDQVGVMADHTGWWGHPECDRWLANTVRMFRGELKRPDGAMYLGDAFRHPLHAATTSWGGEFERGGNLEWNGGPAGARPDLMGWHWYPWWGYSATYLRAWLYTATGAVRYGEARIGDRPRLISEFGAKDRYFPEDTPSTLYPSLYHFALWPAIMTGQAGTPMDWDDGKEFGEVTSRDREGIFHHAQYPINNAARLKALRTFLGDQSPEHLVPCGDEGAPVKLTTADPLAVYGLSDTRTSTVIGWLIAPRGEGRFNVRGLPKGRYRIEWADPWTGEPLRAPAPRTVTCAADGVLTLDTQPAFAPLREKASAFPTDSRLARGYDLAFRIVRLP